MKERTITVCGMPMLGKILSMPWCVCGESESSVYSVLCGVHENSLGLSSLMHPKPKGNPPSTHNMYI